MLSFCSEQGVILDGKSPLEDVESNVVMVIVQPRPFSTLPPSQMRAKIPSLVKAAVDGVWDPGITSTITH